MQVTLNVNAILLNNFYKTCKYLSYLPMHDPNRVNCSYNKSVGFQYIIKSFNDNVINLGLNKTYSLLKPYNDKIKKGIEISFFIEKEDYISFKNNFILLNEKRPVLIRLLMWNFILGNKLHNKIG